MVVCVCNAIRERDVREAARAGCTDPLKAYASMGRRPRCGQCLSFARELMSQERIACA